MKLALMEWMPWSVLTSGGKYAPLGSVARLELAKGSSQISREKRKRRVVVQANARRRYVAGVVKDVQNAIDAKVTHQPGVWLTWSEQFENLERAPASGGGRGGVLLALIGGVLAIWLRGVLLSIYAVVCFIAFPGVAVLNGLVMVGAIDELSKMQPRDSAVRTGALRRLRPVLMTALVASLGFVPMALANGAGPEVQRPLAKVVICGLISVEESNCVTGFNACFPLDRGRKVTHLPARPRKQLCQLVASERKSVNSQL